MDHAERDRGERLDGEIAIGHGVERIGRHAIEAELARGRLAIERVARPGERARAQRRHVGPPPRVRQPAAVAFGHLDVRQQVVGQEHGLGRLDVGRAGKDRAPVTLGQPDQGALERDQAGVEVVDRTPRPEAEVRGDLVVARSAGVELAGDRTDLLGQRRLEVEVDVLEGGIPGDRAGRDVAGERGQARRRAARPRHR